MGKPAVSVVIPTYNRASMLREALDSVAGQTFRDFEVIVVDDGSTEQLDEDIADHPVAPTVIRQRHAGPAAARNRGIKAARADFIAFLDSDDLWRPRKLERFMEMIQAGDGECIFYGPMAPINERREEVSGRTKPCYEGRITEHLFRSSFVHVPAVVCRKEILIAAGGFNEDLPVCEDYDLWLRLSVVKEFKLIPQPLAWRRLHDRRLSKERMSRNLHVKAQVLQRFYESQANNRSLDPAAAHARLARVWFLAARAAFWTGEYQNAAEFSRMSREYGQSLVRTGPISLGANLLRHFR